MLSCTYIVFIYNNQGNIRKLIKSLKSINGDFYKEFIFIDDGSTDDSLAELKSSIHSLSRSTIITQKSQGSTISINKAIDLANGEYIHFVEGSEAIFPDSSKMLMEACSKFGAQVAIGQVQYNNNNLKISRDKSTDLSNMGNIKNVVVDKLRDYITGFNKYKLDDANPQTDVNILGNQNTIIVPNPIKEILIANLPNVNQVGGSGTMVKTSLLEAVSKADNSIYTHYMSLSLRCGKYGKFALINKYVTTINNDSKMDINDRNFIAYNNVKSVYNFAQENPEIVSELKYELLHFLANGCRYTHNKLLYTLKSLTNKYLNNLSINEILILYQQEIERLF
jgi:glycosyltransferase involved in cell wall biosynthesis